MNSKSNGAWDTIKQLGVSGTSASIAEAATLPLDTAKVRLQLRNRSQAGSLTPAPGPLKTVLNIYRHEGAPALFKGLEAGIHRQLIFTGLRLGLYGSILDSFTATSRDSAHVGERAAAALCTSAIGISLANPSDVVKVRTQASEARQAVASGVAQPRAAGTCSRGLPAAQVSKSSTAAGVKRSFAAQAHSATVPPGLYSGPAVGVYRHIVATEGVLGGLYAGYLPNLIRNSIISAAELVSYDVSKRQYHALGVPDGPALYVMAGLTAGLTATAIGSPADVVSTRIMVNRAKGYQLGMLATCRDMYTKEGLSSFYQGCVPNLLRISAFNVVMFNMYELIASLVL
eukprot:jgi/Ulvmu1/3116/UM015_0156.1